MDSNHRPSASQADTLSTELLGRSWPGRSRSDDLCDVNATLSQLSYGPIVSMCFMRASPKPVAGSPCAPCIDKQFTRLGKPDSVASTHLPLRPTCRPGLVEHLDLHAGRLWRFDVMSAYTRFAISGHNSLSIIAVSSHSHGPMRARVRTFLRPLDPRVLFLLVSGR